MKNKLLIISGSVIVFGFIAYFLLSKKKNIIVNNAPVSNVPNVADNSILSENKISDHPVIPKINNETTYQKELNPVYTESKPLTVITPAITEQPTYQPSFNPVYIASEPTPVTKIISKTLIPYEI